MVFCDVNVYVALFVKEHEHHEIVRPWFEELINGPRRLATSDPIFASTIRIITNHRNAKNPPSISQAVVQIERIRNRGATVPIEPTGRQWSMFTDLCERADVRGELVQDAWIATLAMDHGCEVATFDRDFARFPGLKWSVPGAA
jgi:toxin-antitoxin system PIN domain toxin